MPQGGTLPKLHFIISALVGLFLLLPACGGYLPSPPTKTPEAPTPTRVLVRVPSVLRTLTPGPAPITSGSPLSQSGAPVVTTVVFQPGEREYYHEFVLEQARDALLQLDQPPPTYAEYRETCELMRRHGFDIYGLHGDPGSTTRHSMLAGGLEGMFGAMQRLEDTPRAGFYTFRAFL